METVGEIESSMDGLNNFEQDVLVSVLTHRGLQHWAVAVVRKDA
jgi:hypothetical protein